MNKAKGSIEINIKKKERNPWKLKATWPHKENLNPLKKGKAFSVLPSKFNQGVAPNVNPWHLYKHGFSFDPL